VKAELRVEVLKAELEGFDLNAARAKVRVADAILIFICEGIWLM
jgi:hypothetical protein